MGGGRVEPPALPAGSRGEAAEPLVGYVRPTILALLPHPPSTSALGYPARCTNSALGRSWHQACPIRHQRPPEVATGDSGEAKPESVTALTRRGQSRAMEHVPRVERVERS